MLNRRLYWFSSSGYTLIELMIVLSVFSILLSLVVLQITPTQTASSTHHFMDKLQGDIRLTQELAYADGKSYRFSFSPEAHTYLIQSNTTSVVKIGEIPEHISIEKGTLGYQIVFGGNGNVQKAGTLYIKTDKEVYKLVVQIGAGRFYIEEL
ncbi:MAG: competence type IV pilus minor pilin ComGD [Anaerobacillus sp.]